MIILPCDIFLIFSSLLVLMYSYYEVSRMMVFVHVSPHASCAIQVQELSRFFPSIRQQCAPLFMRQSAMEINTRSFSLLRYSQSTFAMPMMWGVLCPLYGLCQCRSGNKDVKNV